MTAMEDPTPSHSEPAGELFDRWLSHREGAVGETRAPVGPVTPDAALEAEQVALAVRLAEEAHEAHEATTATAGSVVLEEPPTPAPAAPPEERLSWSSTSALSRLARRLRPTAPATTTQEPTSPPRVTLVQSSNPSTPPSPPTAPQPATPATPVSARTPVPDARDNGHVVFKPRTGARRLVGLLLLASLAATAYAGYEAYDVRTTNTIAVAATLGALSLVLWALRAGSSAPRLSVTSGQLEVLGSAGRFVFDLDSPYTPIEVVGTAGKRGWRVLFLRRGMSPFVIDSSMVDPTEFMSVLRRHRPERTD